MKPLIHSPLLEVLDESCMRGLQPGLPSYKWHLVWLSELILPAEQLKRRKKSGIQKKPKRGTTRLDAHHKLLENFSDCRFACPKIATYVNDYTGIYPHVPID
jgi:hypothetical protein